MTMEPSSILVGRCYRDRFGAIYKVTSYDGLHIGFTAYMKSENGGRTEFASREVLPLFIRDLQEEIRCPSFTAPHIEPSPPAGECR